jgi:hypothetical protein
MITDEIRNSFKAADRSLALAQEELNRPHEDVVTLSACQSVRSSMKDMMHLYLLAHTVDNDEKASLEQLMDSCVKVNNLFSKVDIANIECKGLGHESCNGKYCLSIENVNCCLTAATQLRSIVRQEFMIND